MKRAVTGTVVFVIEQPRYATCGACNGEPMPGACPQCGSAGHLGFPPMPTCGAEGCDPAGLTLVGHYGEDRLPTYECSNGHLTAIRFAGGRADA